jgi:hypothetical protein
MLLVALVDALALVYIYTLSKPSLSSTFLNDSQSPLYYSTLTGYEKQDFGKHPTNLVPLLLIAEAALCQKIDIMFYRYSQ